MWPPEQKEKKEKQNKTPRQVGSVHALLPAEAGPVVLITESGGPHRCPSQTCRQVSSRPWGSSPAPFSFFYSPESSCDGRHLPLASSKMPSKQWMFCELGKVLQPVSWRTEHQVGPRNPEYLMQESHPLEIIDLQKFFLA